MSDTAIPAGLTNSKAMLLIAYALFAVAPFNGLTAIAGVILVYSARENWRGANPWDSHGRNLIFVFWVSAIVTMLALIGVVMGGASILLTLYQTDGNPSPEYVGGLVLKAIAAHVVALVFVVWYLYRTLRGAVHAIENKIY